MNSEEIYTPPWRKEQENKSNKKTQTNLSKYAWILIAISLVVIVLGGVVFVRTYIAKLSIENTLTALDDTTPYATKFNEVGSDTFTIEWKTKTPTIGFIKYGLDDKSMDLIGQASENSGDPKKHHVIKVDGLDKGEKYYIEIHSNARVYGEEGIPLNITTLD
jgi:hypothetical protein